MLQPTLFLNYQIQHDRLSILQFRQHDSEQSQMHKIETKEYQFHYLQLLLFRKVLFSEYLMLRQDLSPY